MTLQNELKELHLLAQVRPGNGVRIWLRSLAVEIAWQRDWTTLFLFREGYYPTEDEFRRVLESLPYPISFMVTPVQHQEDTTYYIITEWPTLEAIR